MNRSLGELTGQLSRFPGAGSSYVLRNDSVVAVDGRFEQRGSAPNLEGGVLTLCTCKHRMRTQKSVDAWKGSWIAGFTSTSLGASWLFYLTLVADAYEAHSDLWEGLSAECRNAKAASHNFLGDVFAPKGALVGNERFRPENYGVRRLHAHRTPKRPDDWRKDIDYLGHGGRRPALLVGDPELTFLWDTPKIKYMLSHNRNQENWDSISALACLLRPV